MTAKSSKQLLCFDLDENVVHSIYRRDLDINTIASLLVCLEARNKQMKEPMKALPCIFGLNDSQPPRFTHLTSDYKIDYKQFEFITIIRPYAIYLFAELYRENKYDLAVFSMGSFSYVHACCFLLEQQVREYLNDQSLKLFKHIKTREDAKTNESIKMDYKDLSQFSDYPTDNILLIDNLAFNFSMQTRQGVPMVAYDTQFIQKRECNASGQLVCDIGLLRLHHYLRMLDEKVPLSHQNIFGVVL